MLLPCSAFSAQCLIREFSNWYEWSVCWISYYRQMMTPALSTLAKHLINSGFLKTLKKTGNSPTITTQFFSSLKIFEPKSQILKFWKKLNWHLEFRKNRLIRTSFNLMCSQWERMSMSLIIWLNSTWGFYQIRSKINFLNKWSKMLPKTQIMIGSYCF